MSRRQKHNKAITEESEEREVTEERKRLEMERELDLRAALQSESTRKSYAVQLVRQGLFDSISTNSGLVSANKSGRRDAALETLKDLISAAPVQAAEVVLRCLPLWDQHQVRTLFSQEIQK